MSQYGIPYMGSKDTIIASLAMNFPKADHFYDLFGGGFSVTHYMLQNKVGNFRCFHYNEIKAGIVKLIKKALAGEYNYDRFKPEWVSREKFYAEKENDSYIKIIWSFGNSGKEYLFGKDIQEYKRSMHMAVVFGEFNQLAKDVLRFGEWPRRIGTIKARRIYLRQLIEHYRKTTIPKCLYPYLPKKELKTKTVNGSDLQLKQLQQLERIERLQQLEQIERLQQLEQLEQLLQIERLQMTAFDYRQVEILQNSVVYCDIPYENTAGYGAFDRKAFFDWAASRDCPVYISEYHVSDKRFKEVYAVSTNTKLQANGNGNKRIEKLYWNGV